jgi:hypothetical protein
MKGGRRPCKREGNHVVLGSKDMRTSLVFLVFQFLLTPESRLKYSWMHNSSMCIQRRLLRLFASQLQLELFECGYGLMANQGMWLGLTICRPLSYSVQFLLTSRSRLEVRGVYPDFSSLNFLFEREYVYSQAKRHTKVSVFINVLFLAHQYLSS